MNQFILTFKQLYNKFLRWLVIVLKLCPTFNRYIAAGTYLKKKPLFEDILLIKNDTL